MKKLTLLSIMSLFMLSFSIAQTTADFSFTDVCFGDSITFTSNSTSTNTIISENWDIDSNGLFDDGLGTPVKYKPATYKTYIVGLQVITNADTAVIYKHISLLPQPSVSFTVLFQRQCVSSNFFNFTNTSTLSSGTFSSFWDLDNGTTSISKDTSIIYFAAGTYNVKLIVTSDMGCKDSFTLPVYVLSTSVPDFTIDDSVQCLLGNSFVFTENSLVCDALLSFSWDLDGDGVFGESANVSPLTNVFTTPGTYKVGLHITTSSGTDSVYKNVYVNPTPSVSFLFVYDTAQCLLGNKDSFFNATVLGGPGTLTYSWHYGDGNTSTLTTPPAHTYASSGYYNVKLVAISDKGCKDSLIEVAHIYAQPTVDFDISDTISCISNAFNFTNTSTISSPWNLSYVWDFGDGDTSQSKDISHTYLSSGDYTVKLIATSDSGCFDSLLRKITVISVTQARFDIDDSVKCVNGDSFKLTNTSINCSNIVSIRWDTNNDGNFDNGSGGLLNLIFTAPGIYPVGMKIVTITDSATIYRNLYVAPVPVASFTVNNAVQPLATNFFKFTNTSTITPAMALNYIWYFGDGDTSHSADSTQHIYSATGNYNVKLLVESAVGCQDSVTQTMQVFTLIGTGFIADNVCFGDSTVFTDTSKTSDPIVSIDWDLDNNGSFNDGSGASIKHLFPAPGNYTVGVQVTTTVTVASLYKTVKVFENPVANFTVLNTCQGDSTRFYGIATTVNDTIKQYLWDFDNDGTDDDSSGRTPSYMYSFGGTKVVKLTIITNNSCQSDVTQSVTINFKPSPDFSVNNVCEKDSAWFIDNSTILNDSIINLLWDYGDGNDAIIRSNHPHYYELPGPYIVRLIALTDKGCKDTISKPIEIYPRPDVTLTFSGPTAIYENQNVKITANGSFDSALWSTGATTFDITVNKQGIYNVEVTDSNGCKDTTSAWISIIKVSDFRITDVITPNGDNVNDYLHIYDLPFFTPIVITIYNRWGDQIFTSDNYNNDWDATRNGEALPEGAYYYVLQTRLGTTYKGTINVLR